MSDLYSGLIVQFGKHTTATDFSSTPGSPVFMIPDKYDGIGSPARVRLPRNVAHPQNKRFPALAGPIDMSKPIPLGFVVRGLNGNNGGAITPSTTNDIAAMLDVIVGTASINPSGAATTSTGGVGATPTLIVTDGTNIPNGMVVLFTTDAGPVVRQVRSGGGTTTLTLDRTYSGNVTNGANVIRFARWKEDTSVSEHIHGWWRFEWIRDRREFRGCMSRASLDFTIGQAVRLNTSWLATDVVDVAEGGLTFASPTTGSALVTANNNFFVGNGAFFATDLKADFGGALIARRATSGPQGLQGYMVQKGGVTPKPTIAVKLQRGANTGEVNDSTGTPSVNSLQAWDKGLGDAMAGFDIAFQVGTQAGAVGYFVAQNASCIRCDEVTVDGYKMLDCVFECDAASNAVNGPFELHLG